MKHIILGVMVILLAGCGEKFDASSDYQARISYNRILKDLKGEGREEFIRQYELYTRPYLQDNCILGKELCTVTRLKYLDGMSAEEVIRTASEYEIAQKKLEREAAAKKAEENKRVELKELEDLHTKWRQRESAPQESKIKFKIDISPTRIYGRNLASWKTKNVTDHVITAYHVAFDIVDHETGKEHLRFFSEKHSNRNILPGGEISDLIPRDDIQDYLKNDRYSVTGYMTDIQVEGVGIIYAMPAINTYRYEELKKNYPEEFKEVSEIHKRESDFSYAQPAPQEKITFSDLMRGFPSCAVENVYYDKGTKSAHHPFFLEHQLAPYKVENDFAYYRLKTSYMGVPVVEFMIPASTWDVRSITFDIPVKEAAKRLDQALGSGFGPNNKSGNGESPELMEDPFDDNRSILVCTSPE